MSGILRKMLMGLLICCLIFFGIAGCGTDDDEAAPPELPPDSSLTMDFSAFGYGKTAPELLLPGTHFINAATRVLLLDAAIIVTLAPPVAVFKEAKKAEPVPGDDGSWVWGYSSKFLGINYDARLIGRLEGNNVAWSMRIDSDGFISPLEDFEWYTGESALNNKSGNWKFFDVTAANRGDELGTIEWVVEDANKAEIVFSNTNSSGPNFGDTLLYSVDGTTALISFFDASEGITAEITWDLETIAGSIKVPNYNGGERAYWDENKKNIDQLN